MVFELFGPQILFDGILSVTSLEHNAVNILLIPVGFKNTNFEIYGCNVPSKFLAFAMK